MIEQKIKAQIKKLPKNSGVYIFRDKNNEIIYVGKATDLKNRVGSYFLDKNNSEYVRPIEQMIAQVVNIETQKTETVLEALILEANLIKKHQPKYNVEGKDDKTFSYFVFTKEEFPRILIKRESDLVMESKKDLKNEKIKYSYIYGPYTSKVQMQIALKIIRKIFPFHSRNEKSEKGCLEFQIGLCPGPFTGAISQADYKKNILGIRMILAGKKKRLLAKMEKEMREFSQKEEFERAQELRDKIFALKHIQEIALLGNNKREKSYDDLRIEAYDISNISGEFAVGSMVVFGGLKPEKSQYRKFKIKTIQASNDVGMMREVLLRRFNNKWKKPNLIILDGGAGHLNMGREVSGELGMSIEIVGVAKGPTRKKLEVVGINEVRNEKIKKIISDKKFLKNITDEAHRFAITYHRKLREKI